MRLVGSRRRSVRWVAAGALVLVLLVGTAALAREVLPVRSILGLTPNPECTPSGVYTRLPDSAASRDNPWQPSKPYPIRRDEVRATALGGRIYVGTGLTVNGIRPGPSESRKAIRGSPGGA